MFIFVVPFLATRKTFILLSFCIFVRVITLTGRMAAINRRQLLHTLLLILRKRRQRRRKKRKKMRRSRFWLHFSLVDIISVQENSKLLFGCYFHENGKDASRISHETSKIEDINPRKIGRDGTRKCVKKMKKFSISCLVPLKSFVAKNTCPH